MHCQEGDSLLDRSSAGADEEVDQLDVSFSRLSTGQMIPKGEHRLDDFVWRVVVCLFHIIIDEILELSQLRVRELLRQSRCCCCRLTCHANISV